MSHLALPPATGRRGPHRRWSTTALALVAIAAILVVLGRYESAPAAAPTSPAARAAPEPTPSAAPGGLADVRVPAATRPTAADSRALPGHLSIPAIGVSTDLVRLGLNEDRTVEVPHVAARAGWFDQGPVPGQAGSSVILGHVDSQDGPAVFYRLSELDPGNRITVRLADGAVAQFEVVRVATYLNADFPAQQVYAGSTRRPTLNLVTCGGEYDAARGGYQSNVVVFTEHLGTTGAG